MQLAIELPDDLGKELLQAVNLEKISDAKKGHLPVTQSFIGLLAGSNLDESDYKKHLEDKYL